MNRLIVTTRNGFLINHVRTLTGDSGDRVDSITISGDLTAGDGHHTIDELYEHRHALWISLCKIYDNYETPLRSRVKVWKSKLHFDGTFYEGWFLLGMTVTNFQNTEQISYHLPIDYWNKINVIELDKAPEWDGHTANDVLERLLRL